MSGCIKYSKYHSCEEPDKIYKDEIGNEYCILHAPTEVRIKHSLEKKFNQVVDRRIRNYDCNFSGCHFEREIEIQQHPIVADINLNFRDCIFESNFKSKGLKVKSYDFTGAHFLDSAIFDGTAFNGEGKFDEVVFAGEASFASCVFKGKANYQKVEYRTLDFRNTAFYTDCFFGFIKKIVDDQRNVADKQSEKSTSPRLGDLDFSDVIIGLDCKVTFERGSLTNAVFSPRGEGVLEFFGCHLQNVSFMNADLSNCVFNRIDLSESFFSGAKLSETRFIDCSFREEKSLTYKRIVIFDEFYDRKKEYFHRKGWWTFFNFFYERTMTLSVLEETYCALKNNFESNKDYVTADKFHFSEMEMKRVLLGADIIERGKAGKWDRLFNLLYYLRVKLFSFYPWYKYLSGYGTSYIRAFCCILISLLFFSISYMFTGLPNIEYEIGNQSNLIVAFKDFTGSFLYAIGILIPGISKYFADNVPTSTKWFTVIEFIVMWTLIPLFILALKRHFKR